MSAALAARQTALEAPVRSRQAAAWIPPLALAAIMTARFVWVAGVADFGWTYEAAARIAAGEHPYRDFVSTLPPLPSYTLAALLAAFGDSLWWSQIHLYVWWWAALLAGAAVARRLVRDDRLAAASMLLATIFSAPSGTTGHAYNYAAVVFSAAQLLVLDGALRRPRRRSWLLLGLLGGAAIFAKQNVALAAITAAAALLGHAALSSRLPSPGRAALAWVAGLALGAGVPAAWLAARAGPHEVFAQLLVDGVAGKGGLLRLLARAAPRVVAGVGSGSQRLLEVPLSLAMLGGIVVAGWRLGRAGEGSARLERAVQAGGLAVLGLAALLSAASLAPCPPIARLQDAAEGWAVAPATFPAFLAHAVSVLALGWAALCSARRRESPAVPAFALAVLLGAASSSITYYTWVAPLVVPAVVATREGPAPRVRSALALGGALLVTTATFLLPAFAPTFRPLVAIPSPPAFAGLAAAPEEASRVARLADAVAARVGGRRTLWLSAPGPHAAYGGRAVPNVASLHGDTFSPRVEAGLEASWTRAPPDFVVVGPFGAPPGASLLSPAGARAWVAPRYLLVWEAAGDSLWQLR